MREAKDTPERNEPGPAWLAARLAQAMGIFLGVAVTAWTFLYLFGLSMQYNNMEKVTAVIPAVGAALFLLGWKRHARPAFRWAFLEFFAASLATYLVFQFVLAKML